MCFLFFDLGNMAILPFAGTCSTNYMATTRGADLKSCVCVFSLVYVFVLGLGWNMDVAENGLYTSLHQNSHSFEIVKGKLMTRVSHFCSDPVHHGISRR